MQSNTTRPYSANQTSTTRAASAPIDKTKSLEAALTNTYSVQEIRDRIKTNEDHILQLFVKRLSLPILPTL